MAFGLSANEALEQQEQQGQRRRRPPLSEVQPVQWASAAALATGLLWAFSKFIIRRGPSRVHESDPDRLPTHILVNSKGCCRRRLGRPDYVRDLRRCGSTLHTGVEVHINPIGCAIERLLVPDRNGKLADVVLGYDTKAPYLENADYFGVVVGRCANRIANATFIIDGKQHRLAANDGGRHALHGGPKHWGVKVWNIEKTTHEGAPAVLLTYTSRNGDEGYPGTVRATVTYVLTEGAAPADTGHLRVIMEATTDQATPVNMAQHSYWNLAGHDAGDILGHSLTINADHYTPVDGEAIPTGELEPVKAGPFDFVKAKKIGARIQQVPGGYDHNYVLKSTPSKADPKLRLAAVLQDPASRRTLEIACTAPGLQFYSGNFLDGSVVGKALTAYGRHAGVALEAQAFPDSVNQPQFPSVVLRPDAAYRSEVGYTFRTK